MTDLEETKVVERAAVKAVQDQKQNNVDGIETLPSGIKVKFHPVGPMFMRAAQQNIADPIVPLIPHPNPPAHDPDAKIENPNSPKYRKALLEVEKLREQVSIDAMLLMGLELVDGLPEDDRWLKVAIASKIITRKEADEADEETLELWYKKFVVADQHVYTRLGKTTGVTQEQIAAARNSFPG